MQDTKYQLISIGNNIRFKDKIIKIFKTRLNDLGIDSSFVKILDKNNFHSKYKSNAPTVALYFSSNKSAFQDLDILNKLISDAAYVLPLVKNSTDFTDNTPNIVHKINGTKLVTKNDIEAIVSSILEGLSLLRLSRRIFISYKRDESSGVAIQLFERLEKAGFDVFLDTHSVRPGDNFQDELWHRLADTDVVVLLNTKNFLNSEWTKEELAKANGMSIGLLQLTWPGETIISESKLSEQHFLHMKDFIKSNFNNSECKLKDTATDDIVNKIESFRARCLASRQALLIKEFMDVARKLSFQVDLQPEKFIILNVNSGEERKEYIILPTVGVPHAFTYNQSEELVKKIREDNVSNLFLLYDHLNIREKWLEHLNWLDSYLPIKSKKIAEVKSWLEKI